MQSDFILWLALLYLLKRSNCFSAAELLCFFGMLFCKNLSCGEACENSAARGTCCQC